MKKYYVYVFLREDRYTPYYVGKGSGPRCFVNKGRPCNLPPNKDRVVKIKENLTEEESFDLEKILILFWGKKSEGGILLNKSDGGEGTSGWKPNQDWIDKRIKYMSEHNPFVGKTHTETTKNHLSEVKRGRVWVTNGKVDKMVFKEDIPDGFYKGRVSQNLINPMSTKGMYWVTDGKENKMVRKTPDGFYKGRVL